MLLLKVLTAPEAPYPNPNHHRGLCLNRGCMHVALPVLQCGTENVGFGKKTVTVGTEIEVPMGRDLVLVFSCVF